MSDWADEAAKRICKAANLPFQQERRTVAAIIRECHAAQPAIACDNCGVANETVKARRYMEGFG